MLTCQHCGTPNRDETRYCKNCGAQLSAPTHVACQKCGTRNPAASLFCNRCGERLAGAVASSTVDSKTAKASQPVGKAAAATKGTREPAQTGQVTTLTALPKGSTQPTHAPESIEDTTTGEQNVPDWLSRFYEAPTSRTQLIPTHELLRMANALGIDVDYSTLRFWQKRGLVAKPIRGPVSSGRGTRGYYDPSLMDRLSFIREIQKNYAMGLETIREELERIDKEIAQKRETSPATIYRERLTGLQSRRDTESKRTLISMLGKALGVTPEDIATVVIRKKDGETIRLLADKVLVEQR